MDEPVCLPAHSFYGILLTKEFRRLQMKIFFLIALIYLINTVIITTIIDAVLMGALSFHFSFKSNNKKFLITKENSIDLQDGNKCAAFSSAYVLRHWDIMENGAELYNTIPNKRSDGNVYPKGIRNLLIKYGFHVKYCSGNLNALKREICAGHPVIVMIRTYAGKNWLHYVPVVGYDEQHIFVAESMKELVNCEERHYNRKITNREFRKLWNTSMLKMPFYRNTYIVTSKDK